MICVLIVDDQPDIRLAFAFMLDTLGCKVAEAQSGEDALRYLAKHRVDVVLVDIRMPDMNGIELTEAIRTRRPPHPKIIAITGADNLGARASLQAAVVGGADEILTKPVTKDKLLSTIRRLMGDERDKKLGR